jgi:hypothetical protein
MKKPCVVIDVDKDGVYSYTLKQIEPRSQIEGDNNIL